MPGLTRGTGLRVSSQVLDKKGLQLLQHTEEDVIIPLVVLDLRAPLYNNQTWFSRGYLVKLVSYCS